MKLKHLPLFLLMLLSQICIANHIIGGQISFNHSVDNTYNFKLEIYRDCISNGADFDDPANVSLFMINNNVVVEQVDFAFSNPIIESLGYLQDDCMFTPFPSCIQKGTYNHEILLTNNPNDFERLVIGYQRCCRGSDYTNIDLPNLQGFTVWTEIRGSDASTFNNSPTLTSNLFFEVCPGEAFEFDVSASATDGDSLSYELSTPYIGAGVNGTVGSPGNSSDCDGVAPNPICPPPYESLNYSSSIYSAETPLGSDDFSIDPETGILSGIPSLFGQFIVGITVKEYRDDEVISTSYQEATFRVDIALSDAEAETNPLSIYPNPVKDVLNIEFPPSMKNGLLSIRGLNGKVIRKWNASNKGEMSLSTMGMKGLYFLELKSENLTYYAKFVVL